MTETRLKEMADAIGAPMKPRRIGFGPHTRENKVNSMSNRRHIHQPSAQLRKALTGATARMILVGTVNNPVVFYQYNSAYAQ
jgi:hypothetical protein